MTILERWRYGDPAQVAERAQAQTCKGCVHEVDILILGETFRQCGKSMPYGKRCKFYKEYKLPCKTIYILLIKQTINKLMHSSRYC